MIWKLCAPVLDAEFCIEFRIAIVSQLHRDRNSGFGGFHYKTLEFGNPDSGFEFRIAIVSRYDRDKEFTSCSGLACLEFDAPEVVTPYSSRRGVCRVFVAGVLVVVSFVARFKTTRSCLSW